MKIFSSAQIKACDAFTIQASRIQSLDLMERAANKCANWIRENLPKDALFIVLCGTGNNGGDGLAIARLLHNRGYGVKAFILRITQEMSNDCNSNLIRLQQIDNQLVTFIEQNTYITDLPPNIFIIDALLGTGLNRPTQGWIASFIEQINKLPNKKIAIDIPSGLPADIIPDTESSIIKAGDTLSFQFYKRTFLHPETATYTGNIHILDIGLDATFINATHTQYKTIEIDDIRTIYRKRAAHSHKGTYGNALIIGGSYGKIGAVVLSARAAITAGAGLVTALLPSVGYTIIQTAVPEVMCKTNGNHALEKIEDWGYANAIGIGPGLGTDSETIKAFTDFIEVYNLPLVVDADALNILAMHPELIAKLPAGSILTPHPKEFSRLFGENTNSMIQIDNARIQAMRYGINIIIKNHHTAIINPEGDCWYNMTGNAGMATAGSGDVLTGIITGLLAQGYESQHAALLGVYLHGLAGDIAAKELSQEAMRAGNIIDYLGKGILQIQE